MQNIVSLILKYLQINISKSKYICKNINVSLIICVFYKVLNKYFVGELHLETKGHGLKG